MKYTNDESFIIISKMSRYGGSFVKSLAECYRHADMINKNKLTTTFPEYFEKYLNF